MSLECGGYTYQLPTGGWVPVAITVRFSNHGETFIRWVGPESFPGHGDGFGGEEEALEACRALGRRLVDEGLLRP